jgi:hypothetical protein
MRKLFIAVVLFVAQITGASAVTIHASGGEVTAIEALDLGGTLYNVDFEASSFSTFGGTTDFWGDSAAAIVATEAINDVLNNSIYQLVNNVDGYIYQVNYNGVSVWSVFNEPTLNWQVFGPNFSQIPSHDTAWSYTVPIPAAVWLFGSALAGLGWMRRKQS